MTMVEQLPLALARTSDPDTSRLAAHAVTPGVPAIEQAIRNATTRLLPTTAFTIAARVQIDHPGRWDEGTIRTRVSNMGKRGALVKSEEKGTSPRGRVCDLWILP